MARHTFETPAPYDFAGQIIQIEADKLAGWHGLDPKRVRRVLARSATDYYGQPLPEASPESDNLEHGLRFHPALEEALAYLPAEAALSTFEHTDPTALSRRCRLVAYLADATSPFYTVRELADLLEACAQHLVRNRDALLRNGYPEASFARSSWLNWHLSLLSPTKLPVSAFDVRAELPPLYDGFEGPLAPHEVTLCDEEGVLPRDEEGNLLYSYVWATEAGELAWTREGPWLVRRDGSFEHLVPVERCDYAAAALIEGLPQDVARRLEDGRNALLKAKLDVVDTCVRCLRSRDAEALWPAVLGILTDALLWDDVQRYLRVEDLYQEAGLGRRVAPYCGLRAPHEAPGTLSALLSIVGHGEKELRIGTFDLTKAAVEHALSNSGLADLDSYFRVVGRPGQAALDAALDGFLPLEEQERAFREAFQNRVNAALENEFYEEVVVRTLIRRPLAKAFEPHLRTFAEWNRAYQEATGSLPPLQISEPTTSPAAPRNVFRLDGQGWTIEYGGKIVHLKDMKGLRYLAHLLRHPGREFHVLDLVGAIEGPLAVAALGGVATSRTELANAGLTVAGSGALGPLLDPQAKAEYHQRVTELREELEEAEELGDANRAERIRSEIDWLRRELTGALGLGGRDRPAGSKAELARVNVTRLIRRALDRIAEHHPQLRAHLRAVSTGEYCSYAPHPSEAVAWDL